MSQQEDQDHPGHFVVNVDGGDGGNGSRGGGGGGNPLDAYRSLLLRMRIPPGPFIGLLQTAASQNFSADEFLWALESNPRFLKMFPGITQLLDEGMSVTSAVGAWRQLSEQYQEAAKEMGMSRLARLTPQRVGFLIENNIDLDEFKLRLGILSYAKHTEAFRNAFNAVLKQKGDRQLDRQGWYKFLMGQSEQRLYDTYEGAVLFQELGAAGLKVKQARRLGKLIQGPEGQPAFDASQIAQVFTNIRSTLGSQVLADSGISGRDLALAVLSGQEGITIGRPKAAKRAALMRDELERMARNVQGLETSKDNTGTVLTQSGRPISTAAQLP